ncbi:MAG: carbohydrate ABC transporter permease [Clostridia bacterium]|nr:carbohydrate ABC transporter permease [Clostridia bacterium]
MEKTEKKKKSKGIRANGLVFEIIAITVLGLYSFTLLFALGWGIIISLKDIIDFTLNPLGFPAELRFENYLNAFKELKVEVAWGEGRRTIEFLELLFNSILYVVGCTLISTYTHLTCAYVSAKYPRWITKLMHTIVVVVIAFPMVGSLSSGLVLLKATGVYNNRLMYFLYCGGFTGTNFLIYYSAFKGVSSTYAEAAKIDGAGHYTIMFKIMIPMVKNLLTGMMLLAVIGYWNDWYTAMVYLPSYPNISYALYKFQFNTNNSVSSVPVQTAGCMLVMLPTLLIFLVFRNKFIGNISYGGLKG